MSAEEAPIPGFNPNPPSPTEKKVLAEIRTDLSTELEKYADRPELISVRKDKEKKCRLNIAPSHTFCFVLFSLFVLVSLFDYLANLGLEAGSFFEGARKYKGSMCSIPCNGPVSNRS